MTHSQMITAARARVAPLRAAHLATRAQVQARRERRARDLRRVAYGVGFGLLLGLLFALAGCAHLPPPAVEVPGAEAVELRVGLGRGTYEVLYRFDDSETGATCYLLEPGQGLSPSISCITGAVGD